MKTIVLYPLNEKRHSIYNTTIELLNKKYNLVYHPESVQVNRFLRILRENMTFKKYYYQIIRPLISVKELTAMGTKKQSIPPCDLVFSTNAIPDFKCKYILDLETITALGGYDYFRLDKEKISEQLASKDCVAIICWYEITKRTLLETIDCSQFMDKIKVIPFSMPEQMKEKKRHEGINLLFVSSINNPGEFDEKGGSIALEVFKRLSEKHKNLKFTVRAQVPQKTMKKFPYVRFITDILEQKEMESLFLETDIILEPIPGLNLILESMSHAIPIVCFDFWMIPEMVINHKTGFLIDSKKILGDPNYMRDYLKNMNSRIFNVTSLVKEETIEEFEMRTDLLVKDHELRKRMGISARNLLLEKYSIFDRNKKLLEIIEGVFSSHDNNYKEVEKR